jgi:hypothetical protein
LIETPDLEDERVGACHEPIGVEGQVPGAENLVRHIHEAR